MSREELKAKVEQTRERLAVAVQEYRKLIAERLAVDQARARLAEARHDAIDATTNARLAGHSN